MDCNLQRSILEVAMQYFTFIQTFFVLVLFEHWRKLEGT